MRAIPDPYRVLGVAREATGGEIKAAHRRLAKRYHPDAAEADTERFLAVQDAYQVLSDPLARRAWDAGHRPGPVRADAAAGGRPRAARSSGRPTSDARAAPNDRASGTGGEPGPADRRAPGTAGARSRPGEGNRQRRRPEPFSPSGRDPAADSYTWSAQDVPWWTSGPGQARYRTADAPGEAAAPAAPRAPGAPATSGAPTTDFDVYNRSSGAAWSMASRAYFRKAGADLPRGAAEPFGLRWTTPPGKPSNGPGPGPAARSEPSRTAPSATTPSHPEPAAPAPRTAAARATRAAAASEGVVFGSPSVAGVRSRLASTEGWPSVGSRVLYATIGSLAPAVALVFGPIAVSGPVAWGLLAGLLVVLALLPRAAYLAAAGGTAALVVVAGVVLAEVASGARLPAPFDLLAVAGILVVYAGTAALAALDWPLPRPWRAAA
ncbi:MAG: DnaJ domain-containing protein [Candidatus Limnocylindrales bacterium]